MVKTRTGPAHDRYPVLSHTDGRPYIAESLGNRFTKQLKATGIKEGSAQGLRKAWAARLTEASATKREIASFLAHPTAKAAASCLAKANRAKIATNAMA